MPILYLAGLTNWTKTQQYTFLTIPTWSECFQKIELDKELLYGLYSETLNIHPKTDDLIILNIKFNIYGSNGYPIWYITLV